MADDVKQPPASWWQLTIEILGAVLIAYLFIVVMMTASAQQQVVAALKAAPASEQVGYGTAWAYVREAKQVKSDHDLDSAALRTANSTITRANAALGLASTELETAWASLAQLAARPDILKACDIKPPADEQNKSHYAFWQAVTGCPQEDGMSASQVREVRYAVAQAGDFFRLYNRWLSAQAELNKDSTAAASISERLTQENDRLLKLQPYRADFSDMNIMIDNWFLGDGVFVSIPPSMLQILLSFQSGLFGALLITLVLVVYPQSALSAGQPKAHASRIFLGGLIALCVFIVLSGGAAIVGAGSSFNASQANYMTFAAVGILAGMFSDRVALWLSTRANVFFGNTQQPQSQPPKVQPQAAGGGG